MKLLNKSLLTLICATSIGTCSALTPQQQARVNEQLMASVERGDLPGVQQALAAGADIHIGNDLPLQLAARCGRLPVVQFLVQHGADIHADNDSVLVWAALERHWAVVQYLVRYGADQTVLPRDFLTEYILPEPQTAVATNNWHRVEEFFRTISVQELPYYSQKRIKNLLVPAVQKKLNSACLVLPITPIASRTLSFIIGPHTRAAFSHLVKEDTVVGPNMASE